jgi:hypothetical protein
MTSRVAGGQGAGLTTRRLNHFDAPSGESAWCDSHSVKERRGVVM